MNFIDTYKGTMTEALYPAGWDYEKIGGYNCSSGCTGAGCGCTTEGGAQEHRT